MYQHFMKRMYLNCMFYTHFMILNIMFTFYCMKFYQRHHLLSKSFSPPQRRHGVCVTISIYTLVLPIYVLFLCDFTCVIWLMGQLWPFCVNKMTTTTMMMMVTFTKTSKFKKKNAWYWEFYTFCHKILLILPTLGKTDIFAISKI